MKQKAKKVLNVIILCFVLSLYSCEKDLYDDALHPNDSGMIVKNISMSQISDSKSDPTLLESVGKFKKLKKDISSRMVYDSIFNFYYDDENGKYIQKGDYKSYTFPVYRVNSDEKIENIVFSLNKYGGYDTYLLKYTYSKEQLALLSEEERRTNPPVYTQINDDGTARIAILCLVFYHADTYEYWDAGPDGTPEYVTQTTWVYTGEYCTAMLDEPETNGAPPNAPINSNSYDPNHHSGAGFTLPTNSYNGSTADQNAPPVISTPVHANGPYTNEDIADHLNLCEALQESLNLTTSEFYWLKNAVRWNLAYDIDAYLGQSLTNGGSINAVAFIKNAIMRMMQNPGVYTTLTPFLIEKNIDDTNLNPCSQNVLHQVENATNCDIAKVLAKLNANNSVYNTVIKTEHNYSITTGAEISEPANAVPNSPFNYTIYINPDYTDKTKLFIASIEIHEILHAYFFSIYDDYLAGNPPNPAVFNDFSYLFNLYVIEKYPSSAGTVNAVDYHHQQMATDYADAIARTLQEFQTGIAVPDGTAPNQIYSDLGWFGLRETPVFNALFPLSSSARQRILNRGACEQTGHTIGAGTPEAQNPIGQPCN